MNDEVTYIKFFSLVENVQDFTIAGQSLRQSLAKSAEQSGDKSRYLKLFIASFCTAVTHSPQSWDVNCQITIPVFGKRLIAILDTEAEKQLDHAFCMCLRFVTEFYLCSEDDLPQTLEHHMNTLDEYDWDGDIKEQISYCRNKFPLLVFKRALSHPDIKLYRKIPKKTVELEDLILRSETALTDRQEKVDALAEKIKGFESKYNFVALAHGFTSLKDSKSKQLTKNLWTLYTLAVALIAPLGWKISVMFFMEKKFDLLTSDFLVVAGYEIVVAYFFRVVLHNYKAVSAQILQIDLRLTLCQFIQNYSDHAHQIYQKNKTSLEKFEQIIFSNIVANEAAIPSTFDGLEQIGGIIEKIKNPAR